MIPKKETPYYETPLRIHVQLEGLSPPARNFMDGLLRDHLHRGGQHNGELMLTYDQCVARGIDRKRIKPAIEETVDAGLVEITRKGGRHLPALYALTWLHRGPTKATAKRRTNSSQHHRHRGTSPP